MTVYAIIFAASAKREFLDLPAEVIERIRPKIRDLVKDPRPPGCRKLQGYKDRWRIRIGDYRVVYAINDATKTVDVMRIAHRGHVYE